MKNLHTVKDVVEVLLANIPATRGDDSLLYCYVVDNFAIEKFGEPISTKYNMKFIMTNLVKWNIPTFETVRRARQKLQETYPELRPGNSTLANRSECEKEFVNFSREN